MGWVKLSEEKQGRRMLNTAPFEDHCHGRGGFSRTPDSLCPPCLHPVEARCTFISQKDVKVGLC